jgi:hypothetical protein
VNFTQIVNRDMYEDEVTDQRPPDPSDLSPIDLLHDPGGDIDFVRQTFEQAADFFAAVVEGLEGKPLRDIFHPWILC